ncbi:MAG: hypothetical protein IKB05_03780 [Alphaproteobacteria bacterium]|nr:hypothetical protein [Alphaproteobacteria bacterium]
MKKFNRAVHKSMGQMPPALRQLIGDSDVATATAEFKDFMTALAAEFHTQLSMDVAPQNIKLRTPRKLFGQTVSLDYVASGSIGSVYKITIGDYAFAFKINRRTTTGELAVMPLQKRARSLVNKMHIGSVFEFNGRKYSWVISDFVENDRVDGFESAMEKLYFAYITKGININDAHPNNFKDGRLIDTPSLCTRSGEYDDIKKLTRVQIDIVKKLAYCIKTDDMSRFQSLVARAIAENPAVVTHMFFAMKYAKGPTFAVGKTDEFSTKLRRYEAVINSAKRQIDSPGAGFPAIVQKLSGMHNK